MVVKRGPGGPPRGGQVGLRHLSSRPDLRTTRNKCSRSKKVLVGVLRSFYGGDILITGGLCAQIPYRRRRRRRLVLVRRSARRRMRCKPTQNGARDARRGRLTCTQEPIPAALSLPAVTGPRSSTAGTITAATMTGRRSGTAATVPVVTGREVAGGRILCRPLSRKSSRGREATAFTSRPG